MASSESAQAKAERIHDLRWKQALSVNEISRNFTHPAIVSSINYDPAKNELARYLLYADI